MRKTLIAAILAAPLAVTLAGLSAGPALAAKCGNTAAGFGAWLEATKREAVAAGVSRATVEQALGGLTYNTKVIRLDRNQKSFRLSFEEFLARRAPPSTIAMARQRLKQHAVLLDRVERKYAVAKEVIVAIWALESGSAPIWAASRSSRRWRPLPMTAAAPPSSPTS